MKEFLLLATGIVIGIVVTKRGAALEAARKENELLRAKEGK